MKLKSLIWAVLIFALAGCGTINVPPPYTPPMPMKVNGGTFAGGGLPSPGIGKCPPGFVVNQLIAGTGPPQGCVASSTQPASGPSGITNVTNPPFNAKGDGVTDDTAGIQLALTTACGGSLSSPTSGPHPEVYFPYTAGFYSIAGGPLHQPCSQIALDGPQQSSLAKIKFATGYYGPTLMSQSYGHANLEFGASLFSAGGNSLNLKSFNYDSLGKAEYTPFLNGQIGHLNATGNTKFRIDFVYKLTSLTGGAGDHQPIFSSSLTTESTLVQGATLQGFDNSLDNTGVFHSTLHMSGGNVTFATATPVINTRYAVSINDDGAGTCYLFINGVLNGSSQACSGHIIFDQYETIGLPSNSTARWPRAGNNFNPAWGFIDGVDVEAGAGTTVHTSNYTVDAVNKPVATASTLMLDNFVTPTAQSQDTDPVFVGLGVNSLPNAFFPVVLDSGVPQTAYVHISYLDFDSGLYVTDQFQSEVDHIRISENEWLGIDMAHNDFEDSVHDNNVFAGSACINYAPGFSEGVAGYNLCNQNGVDLHTCYVSDSSSYMGLYEQCQDDDSPGDIILPWIDGESHNSHYFAFLDAEFGSSAVMQAAFGWVFGAFGPELITQFEGNDRNNAPFLIQGSGSPTRITELDWANESTAAEIVKFQSTLPAGPVSIINSKLPVSVPLSSIASSPNFVDTLHDTYDDGTQVPNTLNGGLNTSNLTASVVSIGTAGYQCQMHAEANNASVVITRPPCSQPGTVEVCVAQARGVPVLALAGWNQIGSTTTSGDANSEGAAWWRLAPASETSTITITGATNHITAICGVMGGVDAVSPIITSNTGIHAFTASPVPVTAPALTTNNANSIILSFAEFTTNGHSGVTAGTEPSNAVPFKLVAATDTDVLIGAVWSLGGTTSAAVTYTYTDTTFSSSAVAFSIAFNPASSLGSPAPALPIFPTDLSVSRSLQAPTLIGNGTAGISGGGTLATGSNSFAGTINGIAATLNILTPGFTCTNKVVLIPIGHIDAAFPVASTTTTATFSGTAGDTVDYLASCR